MMSGYADFVEAGGLMSYGSDLLALLRRAGWYVDRLLKGANPGDLPVEQPTTFELVVSEKNARTLGVDIPSLLLARADRVLR